MESRILKKVRFTQANGELLTASERIVRETVLKVTADGTHQATAMILAAFEKEYVVGYLYLQGMIDSTSDIASIQMGDGVVDVRLRSAGIKRVRPRVVDSALVVSKEDVLSCVSAILESPIFTETEAVHSAGLFLDGKEPVSIAEDLGRHNALDKVVGSAVLKNVDFGRIVAASTGRQPTEMISKCCSAGIPIIATKGVPTSLGIELADKNGITIVGSVRRDTMIVYSHPERVQ